MRALGLHAPPLVLPSPAADMYLRVSRGVGLSRGGSRVHACGQMWTTGGRCPAARREPRASGRANVGHGRAPSNRAAGAACIPSALNWPVNWSVKVPRMLTEW